MPLSPTTLSQQLQNMPLVDNEAAAITNLTQAFIAYFSEMSAGVPCVPAILQGPPMAAMQAGLIGLSSPNAGAAAIQTGITAFWTACIPLAATLFIYVPPAILLTPPPGISGLASIIQSVATANVQGKLSKAAACDSMAAAISGLMIGGTITLVGPPPLLVPII